MSERIRKGRLLAGIPEYWLLAVLLAGLALSRLYSYLLFHSLAELFSIGVALALFLVFWNTRRRVKDGYFMVLAVAYAATAMLDVAHMLAYKGMGVFPGYDANLPTQLWVAARALQAVSLVAATFFIGRRPRDTVLLLGYAAAAALLLFTVFVGWFPTCYVEGQGLTVFKKAAEFVIIAVMLLGLALLLRKRRAVDRDTLLLLAGSIVAAVVAELAFTLYSGVTDFYNMLGHLLKVVAFYLVYAALIERALRRPYETLFRDLKEQESSLRSRTQELSRRVKELDCLYGIAALVERPGISLEEIFQGTAELVVDAMQYPHVAAARIVLAGREYRTANYRETPGRIAADIVVYSERSGLVEVLYVEPRPAADEGPFSAEERRLLDAVAERLGRIVERTWAQELLRESQSNLSALIDNSTDRIWSVDREYRLVVGNELAYRTFRAGPGEIAPGESVLMEGLVPDARAEWQGYYDRALGGERFSVEAPSRFSPELRYMDYRFSPIRADDGQIVGVTVSGRDVTEKRKAEEMLWIKDAAMAAAYDAIAIADLAGNLTYVNAALLRMWGYAREEEALGRPAVEFWMEPEKAAEIIRTLQQQDSTVGELAARRRDGTSFDARLTASMVREAAGQPICLLGVFSDITKERLVETSLRQVKEEWEKTFDAVPDLIAIMDVNHHIVRVNRAMAERLGCAPEACLGQPCYVHVHGTSSPPAFCPHTLLLQDHQEHTAELHEDRLGGDFAVTVSPLWGADGQFLGSVHVARDVTASRRAAAEIESLARFPAENPSPILRLDGAGTILYANESSRPVLQCWGCATGEPAPQYWREIAAEALATHLTQTMDLEVGERILSAIVVPIASAGYVNLYARDITERQRIEEQRRLNEMRLNSLLELSLKAGDLSEQEIVQVAIEEAERLTGSQIAYLHFVHPDEKTIQLVAWSEATERECTAVPTSHYPLHLAGIWADCVRQRQPVVHNDYQAYPEKKGYPEGHVHLVRHASVPVFDEGRVALVLGVGNKGADYDEADVRQLLLIGSEVMRILRRKRAEEGLESSLHEKVVLLQEVHHRVKNNLQVISSLLDMQAMTIQDPQTLQSLQDSRNRVRAMAFVHDRLYQSADLARIGAPDYLQSVAGYLYGVYAGRVPPVELHFDIQDIALDLDTAIPCGLLVNELVSNALKYAFPPGCGPDNEVTVSLQRQDGYLRLEVRDNGIGLPAGLDVTTTSSLGLRLVDMLAQQLRGQLEINREGGTAFYITFPVPDSFEEVHS